MKLNTKSNYQKWYALIGICIASFLGCIDFTIVNTALPAIKAAFNTNVNQLQWVINIFILALSTFMVIMGRVADIYGRRKVLYIGMLVFGVSSLFAGLAISIEWLILFRLIQGISCAVLYTATGAIISNTFPIEERGRAMGILFSTTGIGLAVGPVLGGIIISSIGWRWIFFINVPLIIISFIICMKNVKESKSTEHNKIDYFGMILLMVGLSALILAITQGNIWGWTSHIIFGLFILAILMFIIFYKVEIKAPQPIIDFKLFANRMFILSSVATASLACFYCVAFFLMPLYLHDIRGDNGYLIGFMLLPTTAMVALFSPIVGRFVDHYGAKKPLLMGFALFIISAILQVNFSNNDSLLYVLIAFTIMGMAWACVLGPSTVLAISALPEQNSAVAIGASWTLHNIGGAVGLGVGVAIYRAKLITSNSLLAGYNGTMWLLAGVSFFAFIIMFYGFYIKKQNIP
jgi:EmrB/QacA subfamily drug resistance transporter